MNRYTVIIPVFNALEHVKKCIESILNNTDEHTVIHVIDDCSDDGDTVLYIEKLLGNPRIRVTSHQVNLGFVRTANEGIRQAVGVGTEPILLNSDTIVPPRWLERLDNARKNAEARGEKVAAVCPLSNCASFYSVPNPYDNELDPALTVEEMDAIVEDTSGNEYPNVPCAVGFCMLITRAALDATGLFDEEKWGHGYGEETEWSIKAAAAGFSCVLADDVYVWHEHHASFGNTANELRAEHQKKFVEEYPHFVEVVKAWFLGSPQTAHRVRIANRIRPRHRLGRKRKLVFVCHHWGRLGGLEIFQRRLVEELKNDFEITLLYPSRTHSWEDCTTKVIDGVLHVEMSARMTQRKIDLGIFPFEFEAGHVENWFEEVILTIVPDIIHFQHLGGWGTFALPGIAEAYSETVLSVHDDFYLCPSYLTAGWSCGRDAAENCSQCRQCVDREMEVMVEGRHSERLGEMLERRRTEVIDMFNHVRRIVFPSDSVEERYAKHELSGPSYIIRHGVPSYPFIETRKRSEKIRVAWVGGVLREKGWDAFADLCRALASDKRFEFSALGEWHESADRTGLQHVKFLRRYRPEELPQLLQRVDVVIPAVARKEVFGLVVDECIASYARVILPTVPAMLERFSNKLFFWFQWGNSKELQRALETCIESHYPHAPHTRTMKQCADDYRKLYEGLLS